MPASCAKALAPTIALFGCTGDADDRREQAARRVDLLGREPSCRGRRRRRAACVSAITTSSSEVLPARSPIPLTVHSTWRAPARTRGEASSRPRGRGRRGSAPRSTACATPGTRSRRWRNSAAYLLGRACSRRCPARSACAAPARERRRRRPATRIVRVRARGVLGGELDVVAVAARAWRTARSDLVEHLLAAHAQLVLEVDVAGRDEGVDARTARRPRAPARRARCPLLRCGRGRRPTSPRTSRAIACTASKSPSLAIGKPASITSTPSRSSWRAIASFSCEVHAAAGRLLAVAQRGVEDADEFAHGVVSCGVSGATGGGSFSSGWPESMRQTHSTGPDAT